MATWEKGKRGRPPKYKVEFVNGGHGSEDSPLKDIQKDDEDKNLETTDKETAYKLVSKGFHVLEVKSPTADRKEKLYVFKETEKQAREALND